jgi:hypothetical protein
VTSKSSLRACDSSSSSSNCKLAAAAANMEVFKHSAQSIRCPAGKLLFSHQHLVPAQPMFTTG